MKATHGILAMFTCRSTASTPGVRGQAPPWRLERLITVRFSPWHRLSSSPSEHIPSRQARTLECLTSLPTPTLSTSTILSRPTHGPRGTAHLIALSTSAQASTGPTTPGLRCPRLFDGWILGGPLAILPSMVYMTRPKHYLLSETYSPLLPAKIQYSSLRLVNQHLRARSHLHHL